MNDSEPENIKAFNYLTLVVFDQLYKTFPETREIDSFRFVVETALAHENGAKESKYAQLLPDTMKWLGDEGFIKWQKDNLKGKYTGVTLTLKGLTVLGYLPTSIADSKGENQTIIERVRSILSRGADGAATEAVKSIIGSGFALALDSFK